MYILRAHFLYHVAILPKFGPLENRIIDHANARDHPNQFLRENILDPLVRIYSFTRFVKWEVEHYGRKKESTFVGRVFVMHCLKLNIQYLFNKEYLIPNGQYSIKTIILITYEKM